MSWGQTRDLKLEAACIEASRVLGIRAVVWSAAQHDGSSPDYLPAKFPDFGIGLVEMDEFRSVCWEQEQSLEQAHQYGLVRVAPCYRTFDRESYEGLFITLEWIGDPSAMPEWYRKGWRVQTYWTGPLQKQ